MCAEIVNLRQARKQVKRQKAEQSAAENRVLHGRSKAQKTLEKRLKEQAENVLDQGHLQPVSGKDPDS